MSENRSSAVLDVSPSEAGVGRVVEPDEPFRVLLLGDFSGRGNRGIRAPLAGRKPVIVDRDDFDDVLASLQAELRLPGVTLKFRDLEDFHPDRIYRAGEAILQVPPAPAPAPASKLAPLPDPSRGLLDQIVEAGGDEVPEPPDPTGDLAAFIDRAMAPHLTPRENPLQKAQAAQAEATASAALRAILHHPEFQALEAAWRAVWMLVRGLETGEDLKLYLFDATLEELAADPAGLKQALTAPKYPWALLVGNYAFGRTASHVKMLTLLGLIAQKAQAPFLAEGVLSADDDAESEWRALRRSGEARSIGLVLPRFLLRLPYGKRTSPIDSFDFDEMPRSVHRQYLWGNSAFCCAYLLAQSFLKDGWAMRPGSVRRIDGMPLHVYQEDGETVAKPCAEVLISEKQAELLIEQGLMPLASLKEQDAVLLVRFQSIADPPAALAGRWG